MLHLSQVKQMEAIMATKEYWAKRCAELEKHMAYHKKLVVGKYYNTFIGGLVEAKREKERREKECQK